MDDEASTRTRETRAFYDRYWPANVPDYGQTARHVQDIVPRGHYQSALDGGCGTGVCSLALSNLSEAVTAVDISRESLGTASGLARHLGATNIRFVQASLLELPFAPGSFDLVFSWGVIHHTVMPTRALAELVRVLRPGGTLVLAVYLRTWLTPLQEAVRWSCRRLPGFARRPVIKSIAVLVRVLEIAGFRTNVRSDNQSIAAQVEDWFFVPEKHFFSIPEMERLFRQHGLTFELVSGQTGRFKSSSNFIVRGTLPR